MTKVMEKAFVLAIVLVLGPCATRGEEGQRAPATFKLGLELTELTSMNVVKLRDKYCGGELTEGNQDTKNAMFIGCVMYVLGIVDTLREQQKIEPTHALCVPRNVTAGNLIIAVQDYIEMAAPWREQQLDASMAVIAALKAKWPCPRGVR
jgi:hypothetical protein